MKRAAASPSTPSPSPSTPPTPSSRQWLGLIAVSLGVALIVVDMTIVNVILAPIIGDLSITSVEAQWVQESYAIVFAALLLLTGRLSDLYGARRLFLIGLAVFGVTSLAAALAPSGALLIGARFLQGIGGAMILPTSLALVNSTFTGKARGQAFAVWGSTIGSAAAVGPLLGGWLADYSWRWAFGINIPLVAVIVVAALAYLPASPRTRGRVDGYGGVLSVLALGLLAFALIEGRTYGWLVSVEPLTVGGLTWDGGPSPVLVTFVVSALLLYAFWRRQAALSGSGDGGTKSSGDGGTKSSGDGGTKGGGAKGQPLMDVRLFSIPSFRNGNGVTLVVGLGEFGVIAVLPLWLQFTLDYSALQAGFALLALAVGSFCASGASFSLVNSVSALGLVRIGLLLEAAGLALLALIATTGSGWWPIALALFLYGVGVGFATAQVTNVVLTDVPAESAGQGSGIQSAARELGAALGIAVLTTLFFSTLTANLRDRLDTLGLPDGDASELSNTVADSAGSVIPALAEDPRTADVADAAREAMTSGLQLSAAVCAGLLLLALAATVSLRQRPANTEKRHGTSTETEPQEV